MPWHGIFSDATVIRWRDTEFDKALKSWHFAFNGMLLQPRDPSKINKDDDENYKIYVNYFISWYNSITALNDNPEKRKGIIDSIYTKAEDSEGLLKFIPAFIALFLIELKERYRNARDIQSSFFTVIKFMCRPDKK